MDSLLQFLTDNPSIFILLLILGFVYIFYKIYEIRENSKKITREPLVVQIFRLYIGLAIVSIIAIVGGVYWHKIAIHTLGISVTQLGISGISGVVLINVIAYFSLKNIAKNAQEESQEEEENLPIQDEDKQTNEYSISELDKLPWHLQAGRLLVLKGEQYEIKLGKYHPTLKSEKNASDWHQEEHCFISKYGNENRDIIIFCTEEKPTELQLKEFVKIIKKREGKVFFKILIAIEEYEGDILKKIKRTGYTFEFITKNDLLNQLVNFKNYYKNLIYFFKKAISNSTTSLNEIYVPLNAHHTKIKKGNIEDELVNTDPIINIEKYILDWIKKEDTKGEHLAILGQYGQGKSVLSKKVALEMLKKPNEYKRYPIVIELGGSSPRNSTNLELLGRFAAPNSIKARALKELQDSGRLLLIFDAFDEMDFVGSIEELMEHFKKIWEFAIQDAKIIITGRPNLFIENERKQRALRIFENKTYGPYTTAIRLDMMTDEQIAEALEEQMAKDILEIKKKQPKSSFAELIRRPSTLFELSQIWEEEKQKMKQQGLDSLQYLNSAHVTGAFIQKTYERQSNKAEESKEIAKRFFLTKEERAYFMQGIAVQMMLKDAYTNKIDKKTLQDTIEILYEKYPEYLKWGDTINFKQRLQAFDNEEKRKNTLLRDIVANGILVEDLTGSDKFRFSHKSYLEYLVSDFYVSYLLLDKDQNTKINRLTKTIQEVSNFTDASFANSKDTDKFISELLANRVEHNPNRPKETSQLLYKKLLPSWKYQLFPFALNQHDALLPLWGIATLVMILGLLTIPFKENPIGLPFQILGVAAPLLYLSWFFFLWQKKLIKFEWEKNKIIKIKASNYIQRLKIWQQCLHQLNIPNEEQNSKFFKNELVILRVKEWHTHQLVRDRLLKQLFLMAIPMAIGLNTIVFLGEKAAAFAFAVAFAVALAFVFAFARAVSRSRGFAFIFAVGFAFAFAVGFAVTVEVVVRVAVEVTVEVLVAVAVAVSFADSSSGSGSGFEDFITIPNF